MVQDVMNLDNQNISFFFSLRPAAGDTCGLVS